MSKTINYDILYDKKEYAVIINELVDLINDKYYSDPTSAGRPLKTPLINIVKAIIYVLKTGCQWCMLPKEFGNYSTLYKHFLKYTKDDLFDDEWGNKLREYNRQYKYKSNLEKQLIDCTLVKSIHGTDVVGRNPCDRGRKGTKISLQTDSKGAPIGVAANGANTPDHYMMQNTFDNLKVKKKTRAKLYADKGYSNQPALTCAENNNFKLVCENKKNRKVKLFKEMDHDVNHFRYAIEASIGWVKQFKRLILRYDRKMKSYMRFLKIAFAIIIQRKI